MRAAELRKALFSKRGERPRQERHTHLCLHCGSLEESFCSACDEAESYFLSPQILLALEQLADEMDTTREDVLRGLLSVALAAVEQGGSATHTRAVVFLRDLEEAQADSTSGSPQGPLGIVKHEAPGAST